MGKPMSQKPKSTNGGVRELKIYKEEDDVKKETRASLTTRCKVKSGALNMNDRQTSRKQTDTKNVEKMNKNFSTSVKVKVKRKVLADIGNTKGNSTSAKPCTSSKLMDSSCQLSNNARNSSRRFIIGKVRPSLSGATGDRQSLTRASCKYMKAPSDDPKIIRGRKSVTIGIRQTGRNPLPPLPRRSLPVLPQANMEGTNNKEKENSIKLEKGKGIFGVPVSAKPKAKGSVPLLNNHNIRRNRANDVSERVAPKSRAEFGALRRKSIKTVVNKCTSQVVIPYKRQESIGTSKISADKPHQMEVPSSSGSDLATTSECVVSATRRSNRRKSFICLLMARSKLLNEQCGNEKVEDSSSIYDSCNHLEVTEYVDDIYQYYWVVEGQSQPIRNYMEFQKEITPKMRGILVNWLIEAHLKYDLMQETLYLMVTLLDHYLSLSTVKTNDLQLVGLTSLLLASKYEDFWHPRIMDLLGSSGESYTRDQMLEMEKDILRKLKYRLNVATPYVFMLRLLKAAQADTKLEHLAFYLIELCLVEYESLKYKPSLLCASAIYVARCTMQMAPVWTPLLGIHARYQESHLRDCADMILKFQKAARSGLLKVTYEKYMRPAKGKVASIKPLESLP